MTPESAVEADAVSHAQGAESAPESVDQHHETVAESPADAVDVAVDAQSLVQAEVARLQSEAAADSPADVVETPAAESPKPTANKRFVVDLRTPGGR